MTHDELLAKIDEEGEFLVQHFDSKPRVHSALRAVVELHYPTSVSWAYGLSYCMACSQWKGRNPDRLISYPCPIIQAIEKELG